MRDEPDRAIVQAVGKIVSTRPLTHEVRFKVVCWDEPNKRYKPLMYEAEHPKTFDAWIDAQRVALRYNEGPTSSNCRHAIWCYETGIWEEKDWFSVSSREDHEDFHSDL